VKEFLSRDGHPFVTRNVDEDYKAYDDLVALGFRAVPITIVNGRTIKGYDEPALRQALADAAGS
jgi:glutaredoxin-like protein NrdH